MTIEDPNEILSAEQIAHLLAKNTAEQIGQIVLALLYVVAQLKSQPNFDVEAFNRKMVEGANTKMDSKDAILRTILLVAGGRDAEDASKDV